MSVNQLTILGAGLMGGSVALAARKAGWAEKIVAIDRNLPKDTPSLSKNDYEQKQPHEVHFGFDAFCSAQDESACESWLATSDLALLCMPVRAIGENLTQVLRATPGYVSDLGSTKAWLLQRLHTQEERDRYIPGHPMAGHPVGGLENASADLFRGRRWILCSDQGAKEGFALLEELILACGATPVLMSAREHDRAVARTSHVPQILASALSTLADESARRAAGPGFLSATRVAGGAEAMWKDIFETNSPAISEALHELAQKLTLIAQDLASESNPSQVKLERVLNLLEAARALREESQ